MAFSILTTWKSFALVPHLTGGVKTRFGSVDEELYKGILFADQNSKSIAHGDDCGSFVAFQ
jgi:hypothetical protein